MGGAIRAHIPIVKKADEIKAALRRTGIVSRSVDVYLVPDDTEIADDNVVLGAMKTTVPGVDTAGFDVYLVPDRKDLGEGRSGAAPSEQSASAQTEESAGVFTALSSESSDATVVDVPAPAYAGIPSIF